MAWSLSEWEKTLQNGDTETACAGVVQWIQGYLSPEHVDFALSNLLLAELNKMQGSLGERINRLMRNKDKRQAQAGVVLSTLHASKGLEWDWVWILGVEQGVLPHQESNIEEERRLCYVGMTRARHELYLSWLKSVGISTFLQEAGLR